MYSRGRVITNKQLSNAALLVLSLIALIWIGYDVIDGSITFCGRYNFGCNPRLYAGPGDYGYWLTALMYLAMPAVLAVWALRGISERARDKYE